MNKSLANSKTSILIKYFFLLLLTFSCQSEPQSEANTEEKVPQATETPGAKATSSNEEPQYPQLESVEEAKSFLKTYQPQAQSNRISIQSDFGEIEIQLFENTPIHRKNMLYLIERNYFDGTWFHRVSADHVVQAGNNDEYSLAKLRREIGSYRLEPEALAENYHRYGAVAMARSYKHNPEKRSDPYEFYISLGPKYSGAQLRAMEEKYNMELNDEQKRIYQEEGGSPHLDGEHTVFGQVVKGMEVVEKIAKVKTDEGEWPIKNIPIKVRILDPQ